MTMQTGLVTNEGQVPLEGVKIDVRLCGLSSEVTLTQRYRNRESVDVEAVYSFPLEEGSAICRFSARIGDREIIGRVEEREQAFERYDDAMADGHGAFLLDQQRPNVFTASIGNLQAGACVEVSVTYVALLNFEGSAIRLMLPTTLSPRYTPVDAPVEVGQPDAELLNPERWDRVPYGFNLKVEVEGMALRRVECPSHTVAATLEEKGALIELSASDVALDRDFVLLVEPRSPHEPQCRVAREDDGTRVAMVTFFPDAADFESTPREVVFLLDCSGSMGGDSIEEARRALALCLRALNEGDAFNIVRFGSRSTSLWEKPKPYNQKTMEEASTYVQQQCQADLGGTEILRPLRAILEAEVNPGRKRDVLLLTDGQVSNEAEIVALCKDHAGHTRVFGFGIGAGVSEYLVRGVARASKAAAEFIYPGERIEPKVLRMFNRISTPAVPDVRLDWGGLEVEQAPRVIPSIFAGESLTLFARIKNGTADRLRLLAGDKSWEVAIDLERAESVGSVPTLWARQAIADIEEGVGRRGSNQQRHRPEKDKARLVALGERYGLLSSATSYVAVDVRSEEERSEGQAQLRRVPVALTQGWGGLQGSRHESELSALTPPGLFPQSDVMYGAASLGITRTGSLPSSPRRRSVAGGPESQKNEKKSGGVLRAIGRFLSPPARPSSTTSGYAPGGGADAENNAYGPPPAPRAPRPASTGRASSNPVSVSPASGLLYDLLMGQQADGAFSLGEALQVHVKGDWAEVLAAVAAHGEQEVATMLALAVLRAQYANRRAEWRQAAKKAERWLTGRGVELELSHLV